MYGPTECTMNTLGVELTKIKNVANYKYLPTDMNLNILII